MSFSWANFGSFFNIFFDFVPHKIFVFTAMLRLIHTNLNILNWFFLVFTRHVNEHWKFSFKLMLFQLNGRSFIVEFLWGSIGSQHQLHEHFDRVEKDYTRNMNSRMFLQQQTSNVTLKIFIKARWLNKAAKTQHDARFACECAIQSLKSHGFNIFVSLAYVCFRARKRSGNEWQQHRREVPDWYFQFSTNCIIILCKVRI